MKWLVITTRGKNPGDDFARMGVEKLIRHNDPQAEIVLIDKEIESEIGTPQPFDKCIVAGMPLFWSFGKNDNQACPWWRHYVGWLSEERAKFMVLGGGSFQPWPDRAIGCSRDVLAQGIADLCSRSYLVMMRDDIMNGSHEHSWLSIHLPVMPCPSIFAGFGDEIEVTQKMLVNIMPNGAHYPEFNREEYGIWATNKAFASITALEAAGFDPVCHSGEEVHYALSIMDRHDFWQAKVISYAGCTKYFGNRIHGAIMARAAGADAWCVGYDSRLKAVELVGGKTCLPSELDLDELEAWAKAPNSQPRLDVAKHFEEQAALVGRFMKA